MASVVLPLAQRNAYLLEEIKIELDQLPESSYPEVYRRMRLLRGRRPRPGTGPLPFPPPSDPQTPLYLDDDDYG